MIRLAISFATHRDTVVMVKTPPGSNIMPWLRGLLNLPKAADESFNTSPCSSSFSSIHHALLTYGSRQLVARLRSPRLTSFHFFRTPKLPNPGTPNPPKLQTHTSSPTTLHRRHHQHPPLAHSSPLRNGQGGQNLVPVAIPHFLAQPPSRQLMVTRHLGQLPVPKLPFWSGQYHRIS